MPGCHRKGTHAVHWYNPGDYAKILNGEHGAGTGLHIDLVGYEPDGTEYLMTVDHIIPHSKGGPKLWFNLQPMCSEHNASQENNQLFMPTLPRMIILLAYTMAEYPNVRTYLRQGMQQRYDLELEPLLASDRDPNTKVLAINNFLLDLYKPLSPQRKKPKVTQK